MKLETNEGVAIDLKTDTRICPLLRYECIGTKCGWYNRARWACGISLIGK